MNTQNEDYEIIARRMDGEEIELTESQKALAGEIAADAEIVGRALDVRLPGGTLHRVNASIRQSHLAGQNQQTSWFRRAGPPTYRRWAGVSAAVAAAVIVAVVLLLPSGPDGNGTKITELFPPANGEQFAYNTADDDLDFRVEALLEDLADARTTLMLDEDFSAELAIASFEQEMEELMLDGNGLDSWPDQNNDENPL
ncbi:MAG: hypothetical protein K8R91_05380 [Phycisphaerae bacterium]|nr:hypothetical protein [Phycisphaerae bacterium]